MKNGPLKTKVPTGSAGFTILELMITVAVLAIVLGIAVPSFTAMIRQNRLASEANELLAALAIARSEAVKRGTPVTLCPSANQTTCLGVNQWGRGWIVFSDSEGTVGTVDVDGTLPEDVVVQVWPASTDSQINVANVVTAITYRGDGATTLASGTSSTFTVSPTQNCENPDGARALTVNAIGRASVASANCP